MTDQPAAPKKLSGREKLFVDFGPLLAFFVGFAFSKRLAPLVDNLFGIEFFTRPGKELFLALALFLPVFAVAFAYSLIKTRRAEPMLIVVAVITGVMGVLTFILDSKTFIYMKPTIVYLLFAGVLGGGLMIGRNFLKVIFNGTIEMSEEAWRTLTWRFVIFNGIMALANEIAWRTLTADCLPDVECAGEGTWVQLKVFGFTAAYIVFVVANAPFFAKHGKMDDTPGEAP